MEKLTVSTARMGIAAFMKTETRSETGERADIIKQKEFRTHEGDVRCARGLTGYGRVESESLQAGQLFAPGLLHAVAEDALPGVQLQQLDAPQQLIGLL